MRHERIDRIEIKRRAAEANATIAAAIGKCGQKIHRQLPCRAPLQLRFVLEGLGREELADPEQLELDGARSDCRRRVDECQTPIEIAMMVARNLGDKLDAHETSSGGDPSPLESRKADSLALYHDA